MFQYSSCPQIAFCKPLQYLSKVGAINRAISISYALARPPSLNLVSVDCFVFLNGEKGGGRDFSVQI